jgi:hypothetical protein
MNSDEWFIRENGLFVRLRGYWRKRFSFDHLMLRLPERPRRFLVLTRHFFDRFFQNETIPFEDQMKEKLIAALVMLGILGGHIGLCLFGRYMMMEKHIFLVQDPGTWVDKCYFLSFFMALLAFLVVLDWDAMFVDQRDARNLLALPISHRTVFRAKFGASLIFIALYTAAVNSVSLGVVVFFLPQFRSRSSAFLIQYGCAHLISTTAAFVFTFFLFALVNAVLMIIFSPRWYRRLAWIFRFPLLIGLMVFLMMFVIQSLIKPDTFNWLSRILVNGKGLDLFFPPLWFTGLYESLLGNKTIIFDFGAQTALVAIIGFPLLYFYAMSLCFRRHLERTESPAERATFLSRPKKVLSGLFQAIALRHQTERAVYHFVARTIKTSAPHRLKIIGALALGIGLSLILLLFPGLSDPALSIRRTNVLAAPILIGFFLVIGLRSVVTLPISGESNWVFRLTETIDRARYFQGMKKALIIRVLAPVFSILFLFFAFLWNWRYAGLHILYAASLTLVLMELFFWKFNKIPFACLSLPGKAKIHFYGIAYTFAGILFIQGSSRLEKILLANSAFLGVFFGLVAVLLIGLKKYQASVMTRGAEILYEDMPEKPLILLE